MCHLHNTFSPLIGGRLNLDSHREVPYWGKCSLTKTTPYQGDSNSRPLSRPLELETFVKMKEYLHSITTLVGCTTHSVIHQLLVNNFENLSLNICLALKFDPPFNFGRFCIFRIFTHKTSIFSKKSQLSLIFTLPLTKLRFFSPKQLQISKITTSKSMIR